MNKTELKNIIKDAKYKTTYYPIVEVKNNLIIGYSAQSKFIYNNKTISSEKFFEKLNKVPNIFFYLEQKNKKFQIEKFKDDSKLFLQLSENIFLTKEHRVFWSDFLSKYKDKIIVDIKSSSKKNITNTKDLSKFLRWLNKHNLNSSISIMDKYALVIPLSFNSTIKYMKIKLNIIKKNFEKDNFNELVKAVKLSAYFNQIEIIVTGVNTKEDLELIKAYDIKYAQGKIYDDMIQNS